LNDLRLVAANLRNELEGAIHAPEGCIQLEQTKPDGSLRQVAPANLACTEENTIEFSFRVQLNGARGPVAALSVPASVSRTDVGIVIIVEGSNPNMYAGASNPLAIKLIENSLSRQADEVGV
jgi:hypothetical protein